MTSRSHKGLVRRRNEDAAHFDMERRYAVVADGMGGLRAGEVASATAIEAVRAVFDQPDVVYDEQLFVNALQTAHQSVQDKSREMDLTGQMGTTLAIWAQANETACFCGHVGDSRVYKYVPGELFQVTKDHSLAQRMLDLGLVKPNDPEQASNSHILTQAIGLPGEFAPETMAIANGSERFLICSDGLTDMVSDARMSELMTEPEIELCADTLLRTALNEGGRDNVSFVLVDI